MGGGREFTEGKVSQKRFNIKGENEALSGFNLLDESLGNQFRYLFISNRGGNGFPWKLFILGVT